MSAIRAQQFGGTLTAVVENDLRPVARPAGRRIRRSDVFSG